jgi:hypothetical protein
VNRDLASRLNDAFQQGMRVGGQCAGLVDRNRQQKHCSLLHNMSGCLPPPPPYWQLYGESQQNPPAPPRLPERGVRTYQMFGELYERDLPASKLHEAVLVDTKQTQVDFVGELRRLNNSLLVNFFMLTELLLLRPDRLRAKLDEIAALFVNFHHVVNCYREVQARDTIAGYLEQQIEQRRRATVALRQALQVSKESVARIFEDLESVRAKR